MDLRMTFGNTLVDLGREYGNMYVVDADLFTSTQTLFFKEAFPDRFVQVGIAEQNQIGVAAGLALEGKIPVACTFADFLSKRACDQVSISVAYPRLNVKLAGAYPGLFTGGAGATHQAIQDLSNMRAMPDMRVLAPADHHELADVMKKMMDYNGAVYYRIPRFEPKREFTEGLDFEWGKGHRLLDGSDVTIVGTGIASQWAYEAALELNKEGIGARMLHIPCLKPLDEELIVEAARQTGAFVTVENHSIIGGLGSAVAEALAEGCPAHLKRLGVADRFGETGSDNELIEEFGLTVPDIMTAAKNIIAKKGE